MEQYSEDKEWWLNFERLWEHTKITEIIDVIYSDEQISRHEDIKDMPEDFGSIYSIYVKNGEPAYEELPKYHPFNIVRLTRENERLGIEMSQREINEIIHGVQLTDLEIRLLKGGL